MQSDVIYVVWYKTISIVSVALFGDVILLLIYFVLLRLLDGSMTPVIKRQRNALSSWTILSSFTDVTP